MYRNLFGIAAILGAVGYLINAFPNAQAQSLGPVVSAGEAPWVSFTGEILPGDTETIYTVPSDQVFVLTGMCASETRVNVYEDSTVKIRGEAYEADCGSTERNSAHVVFAAGSEVNLECTPHNASIYFVQGYLAHP